MTVALTRQSTSHKTETAGSATPRNKLDSITWSYSRRSTLERCSLQYYFQYFGSNKRTAIVEPIKEELRFLKALSNRHERTGAILHIVVAWSLREAQRGTPRDSGRIEAWARQIFAEDRRYSREYPDGGGRDRRSKFPPVLLREHHYRLPDAEALCDEAEARLVGALRAFAEHPSLTSLRLAGATPGALVERRFSMKPGELPCGVGGQIDLAFQYGGSPTVVDWKLGEGDGTGDDSLQMAAYALWAVEHFGCGPSSLRICKAHLSSAEVIDFHVDAGMLAAARARITQDAIRMAAVQAYGKAGIEEAFTPCALPLVCKGCAFQRVCPEGVKFLHA